MTQNIGDKLILNGKEFIAVEFSSNILERKSVLIRFGEEIEKQIAIFRSQGKLYCITNICPHLHAPSLFRGWVENNCVTCPEHGWTFRLDTGENVIKNQGRKKLKTYEVLEVDGIVYVYIDYFELPKWKKYIEKNE